MDIYFWKIFRGWNVWKYLKMRQNGYKFFKNIPRVTCQNTSKCTKTDINFSKFSGGHTGVRTQTQFKRNPAHETLATGLINIIHDRDVVSVLNVSVSKRFFRRLGLGSRSSRSRDLNVSVGSRLGLEPFTSRDATSRETLARSIQCDNSWKLNWNQLYSYRGRYVFHVIRRLLLVSNYNLVRFGSSAAHHLTSHLKKMASSSASSSTTTVPDVINFCYVDYKIVKLGKRNHCHATSYM